MRNPEDKGKKAAYDKARYIAHREERLAYQRTYEIAHREEIKPRKKAYQAKHREKLKAYNKAYHGVYYKVHREELRAKHATYRSTHKEELRAKQIVYDTAHRKERRTYGMAHRKEYRERELKRRYGLSQIDFDALLESQGGVCAICGKANWNGRGPVVDHEHIPNGKVRGILCHRCNLAAGMIDDDPRVSRLMTDYLTKRA